MKKCARVDYTMIETLQLLKKIVIYRLHHSKKEVFREILSTATNWTRVVDEFRMQESISKDVLKAFNLKDEKSFLSKEEEQSTFAHINFENSSKIIQDLTKALMNETQQLLLTLKSTSTKFEKDSRQNENQFDPNRQTQSDLNDQIQSDLDRQIQFDLDRQIQSDLNDETQLDLNRQTQSDLDRQTQSDLDRQTQSDLNDQTQFDLNRQTQLDFDRQTQRDLDRQIQSDLDRQTQSDFNDQIQSDLNRQTQFDFNRQTQSDLNR